MKEKEVTEDEVTRYHYRLNGHEFEQTLGDSEGQSSLVCYTPRGCKELYMTYRLNDSNNKLTIALISAQGKQATNEKIPASPWVREN